MRPWSFMGLSSARLTWPAPRRSAANSMSYPQGLAKIVTDDPQRVTDDPRHFCKLWVIRHDSTRIVTLPGGRLVRIDNSPMIPRRLIEDIHRTLANCLSYPQKP